MKAPLCGARSFSREIDAVLNAPTIEPLVPPSSIINPLFANQGQMYRRNVFAIDSMIAIGGGAIHQLKRTFGYKRGGGSTTDKLRYLTYSEAVLTEITFETSLEEMADRLYGVALQREVICSSSECLRRFKLNRDASCGLLSQVSSIKKKGVIVLPLALGFRYWFVQWVSNPKAAIYKDFWTTGSRPKLINAADKVEGVRSGAPVARVISVAGPLEPYFALPLYYVVESKLRSAFKQRAWGVAIGVNRHGSDWVRMSSHFSSTKVIITGDYSKYDITIPQALLRRAFDFIEMHFDKDDKYTLNYLNNYRRYYEQNFINKTYFIDKYAVVERSSGMPSGSMWTSVINSIVNVIIIMESMKQQGIDNYKFFVYGDDFNVLIEDYVDGEDVIRKMSSFVFETFGMKLDADQCVASEPGEFFVHYERPVYKQGETLTHTAHLRAVKYEKSQTPFTHFASKEGTSHRWHYSFAKRPKFLQYYWMTSGKAIRPWPETLMRIINPERAPESSLESQALIISHLVDNYSNAHVRNWSYHLLYDHEFMSGQTITRKGRRVGGVNLSELYYNNPDAFKSYMAGQERAWYRRTTRQPNLCYEDRMQKFNSKWRQIEEIALRVSQSEGGVEPYRICQDIRNVLIARDTDKIERIVADKIGAPRPVKTLDPWLDLEILVGLLCDPSAMQYALQCVVDVAGGEVKFTNRQDFDTAAKRAFRESFDERMTVTMSNYVDFFRVLKPI